MTLINFEGRKVKVGETVRLRSPNTMSMRTMTVVTADYDNDRLVLGDAEDKTVTVAPDSWCLVYPQVP